MASRMESTSLSGRIQVSRSTYERVYDLGFEFEERSVQVKGKGQCNTYMMKSEHHVSAIVDEEEEGPLTLEVQTLKNANLTDNLNTVVNSINGLDDMESKMDENILSQSMQ